MEFYFRAERDPYGQADGLMPRTMEIFQVSRVALAECHKSLLFFKSYGLLDALFSNGPARFNMAVRR